MLLPHSGTVPHVLEVLSGLTVGVGVVQLEGTERRVQFAGVLVENQRALLHCRVGRDRLATDRQRSVGVGGGHVVVGRPMDVADRRGDMDRLRRCGGQVLRGELDARVKGVIRRTPGVLDGVLNAAVGGAAEVRHALFRRLVGDRLLHVLHGVVGMHLFEIDAMSEHAAVGHGGEVVARRLFVPRGPLAWVEQASVGAVEHEHPVLVAIGLDH